MQKMQLRICNTYNKKNPRDLFVTKIISLLFNKRILTVFYHILLNHHGLQPFLSHSTGISLNTKVNFGTKSFKADSHKTKSVKITSNKELQSSQHGM